MLIDRHRRMGRRALVLGEGVGASPALTVWQALLDRVAQHADWLRPLLLCHYGARLSRNGLNAGGCGNLSTRARDDETIYITTRGVDKAYLTPRFIRHLSLHATDAPSRAASIEFPMHRACYLARASVGAVVHTHAPALTALPLKGLELGAMLPEMPGALGGVQCRPYLEAGSTALAESVGNAVGEGASLILLERHGAVAVGADLGEAVRRMELGELAAITVLLTIGEGQDWLLRHREKLEGL